METMLLYATAPDAPTAQSIGETLVSERLAACVNILGAMTSIYQWNGAVEQASEISMLIKTTAAHAGAAKDRIIALHPYETPCVIALPIKAEGSHGAFLDWIGAEVRD